MAQRPPPIAIAGRANLFRGALWLEGTRSQANNLPLPPTPLIGREQERARAVDILREADTRLLTLCGTGGVGKTRLALAVGEDVGDMYPDGVFFVPLADITNGKLLLSAIAQSLELYTLPDEDIVPTLVSYTKDMGALFILDNFEQLLPDAHLITELLSRCPRIKFLVTSRFVLRLRGERELAVQPLTVSPQGGERTAELSALERSPALQLFVERARSVKFDFKLDSENACTIAEICSRLDGLPLAIELAATRIKVLSPRALLSMLEKRLHVLTGGAQDLPVRQQTMHNTIRWSYELLNPSEQRAFRLISVFSGGCTLAAMQTVYENAISEAVTPVDVLDLATSLANKSLLRVVENNGDEPRLVMLETVREYAAERLQESGEDASARAAHANFVAALAEEAESPLRGPEQVRWLDRLERETGNVRAALEWSTSTGGSRDQGSSARLEVGMRIAGSLSRFWQARGFLHEGSMWLQILLARTTALRTEMRERALRTAGRLANNLGQLEQARNYYTEALEIARERGDRPAMTQALMGLGNIAADSGDDVRALHAYEECLDIWTELGQKEGIASALNNIGLVFMYAGDSTSAVDNLDKSVQIYREIGDIERIALTKDSLGRAYMRAGDLGQAEANVREGLALNLEIGDAWNIAYGLISLAEILSAGRNYLYAARLLAAADGTYDDLYDRLGEQDRLSYTQCIAATRNALGEETFKTIWSESSSLTPKEALADSRDNPSPASGVVVPATVSKGTGADAPLLGIEELSPREREVFALLARRFSNAEIAEQLYLSLYTVNAHLRNIYSKLNLSSRADARRYAANIGLI